MKQHKQILDTALNNSFRTIKKELNVKELFLTEKALNRWTNFYPLHVVTTFFVVGAYAPTYLNKTKTKKTKSKATKSKTNIFDYLVTYLIGYGVNITQSLVSDTISPAKDDKL